MVIQMLAHSFHSWDGVRFWSLWMLMSVLCLLYKQKSLHAVQTSAESVRNAVNGCNYILLICMCLYPRFSYSSTFKKGAGNPQTWGRLSPAATFQSQSPAFFFELYDPNIVLNKSASLSCWEVKNNLHKNKAGKNKVICSLLFVVSTEMVHQ